MSAMPLSFIDGLIVNTDTPGNTTITAGTGQTTTPTLVNGYSAGAESQNIVHDLIGGGIAAVLKEAQPRSGELKLIYDSGPDAWASFQLHTTVNTFAISSADLPSMNMTYMVTGRPTITLDEETQAAWVVSVPFQEIQP